MYNTTVYNIIIIVFSIIYYTHYIHYILHFIYYTLCIYNNDIYRYTAEHDNTYNRRVCQ